MNAVEVIREAFSPPYPRTGAISQIVLAALREAAGGDVVVIGADGEIGRLVQPTMASIGGAASFGAPGEERVYAKPIEGGGLTPLYVIEEPERP